MNGTGEARILLRATQAAKKRASSPLFYGLQQLLQTYSLTIFSPSSLILSPAMTPGAVL